ncbi:MAG: carboxynorspermidine decarboxylase [Saprospiraceae bacterium]|nr:carboxynorspermidine decarboxylase [Saprospiraceae bacterium]
MTNNPDYSSLTGAAYVLHEDKLIRNLELIRSVKEEAGVSIILALKGFAMWRMFPLVAEYLDGATASSLFEARLIYEEMGCKAHTYCAAYTDREFDELASISHHMVFNSVNQYLHFREKLRNQYPEISCGLRVNPGFSKVEVDMYNPTAPGSRLGIDAENLKDGLPTGIEGLHFHALCENNSYDLEETLAVFEAKFGHLLHGLKWVNMGGGHLMTREGYDTAHLVRLLRQFKEKYQIEVILEPGSAIAWQTGDLVAHVVDIVDNHGIKTLMTDVSFTAHMPDTLEMPYRPGIVGTKDYETPYRYRIGGTSCLSGDFMYEYNFEHEVKIGSKLIFLDMIHYTIVKTTMFNGVRHPDIYLLHLDGKLECQRRFSYEDYKNRMN